MFGFGILAELFHRGIQHDIIDRTGAAALIPEDATREIIQGLPEQSAALSLFRRTTMSRKQQRMPALSALPTAYFVNGDTGQKKTSDVEWENVYLNAEELAVIAPIPEAVLDDSDFDIWGEVRPRIEEAMGAAIDSAIFCGTNAPTAWPDDIVTAATSAANTFQNGSVENTDLADDINAVMALAEADGFEINGFVAAPTFKSRLRGLRSAVGEMIFNPGLTAGTPSTLFGEPIRYTRNGGWVSTSADMIAGDFSKGIVAIRQDITAKILDQAVIQDGAGTIVYNLAQQDMVALRVTFRLAWCVANPINRVQQTKASRYPFAVLTPAA